MTGAISAPVVLATDVGCARPVAEAIPLLERMERAWNEVSDYTSVLLKTERFVDGTITVERGVIKFRKPDQIYLHLQEGGNAGAELIFPKTGTHSVILARPGGVAGTVAGFLTKIPAIGALVPYEFDLHDARLMVGQHHPLPDSTIAGMIHLISTNLREAIRHTEGTMCLHAAELVDSHRAVKIEVHFPADAGTWHMIAEGDTIWTIADDYGQDRYVIVYNNPSIASGKALSAGERIFVPRYYAPRAFVWISESYDLPVKLEMFDSQQRMYESYSNADLRIDVGLTDDDFDPALHGFPAETTSDEEPSNAGTRNR
jgi:hypothetical protein